VGALVIVILGRSRPCTDRILAINFSDRLPPPLSEFAAAGSSKLEPRLPRSKHTLELRRGRAAPGVPPELRRDESSEVCDRVLELRRRLPCDVAPEAVLKAAAAAAATTMASFLDTSLIMSASICSPEAGTCVSAQLKVESTEKKWGRA
jgi:hypothetical protein